jgi:hypothetical protein
MSQQKESLTSPTKDVPSAIKENTSNTDNDNGSLDDKS